MKNYGLEYLGQIFLVRMMEKVKAILRLNRADAGIDQRRIFHLKKVSTY
jgi:hypothetical protein